MTAARTSRTSPTQGTGSVGTTQPSGVRNRGSVSVKSAQVLITYMKAVGRPVTSQTQVSRRVRQSQTVTPRSVSAASS